MNIPLFSLKNCLIALSLSWFSWAVPGPGPRAFSSSLGLRINKMKKMPGLTSPAPNPPIGPRIWIWKVAERGNLSGSLLGMAEINEAFRREFPPNLEISARCKYHEQLSSAKEVAAFFTPSWKRG